MLGDPLSRAPYVQPTRTSRISSLVQSNSHIRRLTKAIHELKADQRLLIYKTQEFSKLVIVKISLEAPLRTSNSSDLDFQILKVILNRTRAVSRYFDPETLSVSGNLALLLSRQAKRVGKRKSPQPWNRVGYVVSRRHASKRVSELEIEHSALSKSGSAIKQLLLRFDEDIAALRDDIAILKKDRSALDGGRSAETWYRLASVDLDLATECEKRRSIASHRRLSSLNARTMSRSNSFSSCAAPPRLPAAPNPIPTAANRGHYQYPPREPGQLHGSQQQPSLAGQEPFAEREALASRNYGRPLSSAGYHHNIALDPQLSKRRSMVQTGKRSGAILSKWDLAALDFGTDVHTSTDSDLARGSQSDSSCSEASQEPRTDTSIESLTQATERSKREAVYLPTTNPSLRPRSLIVPRNRYSMYDQYGRKAGRDVQESPGPPALRSPDGLLSSLRSLDIGN